MTVKPYTNRYLKKRLCSFFAIVIFLVLVGMVAGASLLASAYLYDHGIDRKGFVGGSFRSLLATFSVSVIILSPWIFLEITIRENFFQKRLLVFTYVMFEKTWIPECISMRKQRNVSFAEGGSFSERPIVVKGKVDGRERTFLSVLESQIFGIANIPIVDD